MQQLVTQSPSVKGLCHVTIHLSWMYVAFRRDIAEPVPSPPVQRNSVTSIPVTEWGFAVHLAQTSCMHLINFFHSPEPCLHKMGSVLVGLWNRPLGREPEHWPPLSPIPSTTLHDWLQGTLHYFWLPIATALLLLLLLLSTPSMMDFSSYPTCVVLTLVISYAKNYHAPL